jgi:hypothetical protein
MKAKGVQRKIRSFLTGPKYRELVTTGRFSHYATKGLLPLEWKGGRRLNIFIRGVEHYLPKETSRIIGKKPRQTNEAIEVAIGKGLEVLADNNSLATEKVRIDAVTGCVSTQHSHWTQPVLEALVVATNGVLGLAIKPRVRGLNIVEIGAGAGFLGGFVASGALHLPFPLSESSWTAIELNEKLAKEARKNGKKIQGAFKNYRVINANAIFDPIPEIQEGSVDLVFGLTALSMFRGLHFFAERVKGWLKPGGVFAEISLHPPDIYWCARASELELYPGWTTKRFPEDVKKSPHPEFYDFLLGANHVEGKLTDEEVAITSAADLADRFWRAFSDVGFKSPLGMPAPNSARPIAIDPPQPIPPGGLLKGKSAPYLVFSGSSGTRLFNTKADLLNFAPFMFSGMLPRGIRAATQAFEHQLKNERVLRANNQFQLVLETLNLLAQKPV